MGECLRRVMSGGLLVAALVGAAGCEQLTAMFGGGKKDEASATVSTTSPSPVIPPKPTVPPGEILATVNGSVISKADMELRIQEAKDLIANLGGQWTAPTAQQLEAELDELINSELMSQDSAARGLDRSLETQRRWEFMRRRFFTQEWFRVKQKQLDATSQEIEQFYEQNKLGFRAPERRQLRQIVVATEEQAKQALAQLLSGSADFGALAQQLSLGPAAANGGLLPGWVMRANEKALVYPTQAQADAANVTSLDPALEAAAFAIDTPNALSNYVRGPDARFYLFQLVERKDAEQRKLNEVWDQIKNYLVLQKLQQTVEDLRTSAKIERFPERLQDVAR